MFDSTLPNGSSHVHIGDQSHAHSLRVHRSKKIWRQCCLISSPRGKWGIHFSGHPCGSPRLSLGVYFRALGVCAGGTALACVSSPCTQSAAWSQQLNRGESQPSLNVQLPQSHSFKRYRAMLFHVSMSFSTCLCRRAFPDNLNTPCFLSIQLGLVKKLDHSVR